MQSTKKTAERPRRPARPARSRNIKGSQVRPAERKGTDFSPFFIPSTDLLKAIPAHQLKSTISPNAYTTKETIESLYALCKAFKVKIDKEWNEQPTALELSHFMATEFFKKHFHEGFEWLYLPLQSNNARMIFFKPNPDANADASLVPLDWIFNLRYNFESLAIHLMKRVMDNTSSNFIHYDCIDFMEQEISDMEDYDGRDEIMPEIEEMKIMYEAYTKGSIFKELKEISKCIPLSPGAIKSRINRLKPKNKAERKALRMMKVFLPVLDFKIDLDYFSFNFGDPDFDQGLPLLPNHRLSFVYSRYDMVFDKIVDYYDSHAYEVGISDECEYIAYRVIDKKAIIERSGELKHFLKFQKIMDQALLISDAK